MTKIREMELKMQIVLNNLVYRDFVSSIIGTFDHGINSHFIDLARKVSGLICQKLDRVGQEKTVESIIAPLVEKGIQDIKKKAKDALEVKLDER